MEFYRIWRILVGHKWVLVCLPIIATCVGLGLTYVLPEQYQSTALVLVRPSEEMKFNSSGGESKEVLDFPVSQSTPIDAPSKTYMEEIKSPAVAVKIVEALQLYIDKPKTYSSWFEAIKDKVKAWVKETIRTVRNYAKYGRDIPASPFDRAVETVEENLLVAVRKDTYAFDISYRSGDPKEAAAVANMAARIFLEHSTAAYRGEAARARVFIEKQLGDSHNVLDKARAAVLAYKSSADTFALKSEYDNKLKMISDLEDTLAKDQGKLAGLKRAYREGGSPAVIAEEAEIGKLQEEISALRDQLTAYPEKEARLNAILLNERLAQENFEFLLKRDEEARVRESSAITEIRVVSPAEPSLYPIKPVKWVYAGLSFSVALVLAIGWALFAESLDPRVRTMLDLDDELGVPVLGAIPTLRRLTVGR
jgi:uncharacterized protein involved in exopolysaccharide biosynthesis